jgi:hypothetical protein
MARPKNQRPSYGKEAMRPFSIDWREVLAAIAIFVAAVLTFALLSGAAGWPNATSGWPLAVGVALALALLRATGPALDYLQQVGAKVETPFLKLDFAGVARVAGAPGQPWVLSDDLIRKSPSIPDSALPELERSVENFVNQAEIVVDLEDGGAWYTTPDFCRRGHGYGNWVAAIHYTNRPKKRYSAPIRGVGQTGGYCHGILATGREIRDGSRACSAVSCSPPRTQRRL